MEFALAFRMEFGRDVFIDLLGYRKYGHNEGDEPRFTQPKLYKAISKHKNPRDIYAEKLKAEGVIDDAFVKQIETEYKQKLEEDLGVSLFTRQGRRSVLTPAGEVLLAQGRDLLRAAERLAETTRQVHRGWESCLNIAVDSIKVDPGRPCPSKT